MVVAVRQKLSLFATNMDNNKLPKKLVNYEEWSRVSRERLSLESYKLSFCFISGKTKKSLPIFLAHKQQSLNIILQKEKKN